MVHTKSAIAGHASNQENYEIRFQDKEVLFQAAHYHIKLYLEVIETHKHKENRTEGTLKLNRTGVPVKKNIKSSHTEERKW